MRNTANKKSSVLPKDIVRYDLIQFWASWPALAAFFITFFIYALTAPRSVTFEDSGLFILEGYYWGVSHPPGYPIYTFLSYLFSLLPVGTIAFRVSLLSVLLGALSAWLMYLIFQNITKKTTHAFFASLVVAFSATLWSQMLVPEVYALNTFLCLAFFYACLILRDLGDKLNAKHFFILGLIGSLSLANHWPIFVLCGPGFLFLIRKNWLKIKFFIVFFAGLSFSIFAYLFMWWRSLQNPEISFLGEIKSLSMLIDFIARKNYVGGDVSVLHSWRDVINFYREFFSRLFYKDFFILAAPVFAIGVWFHFKKSSRFIGYSFLQLLATTSLILPFLMRLEYNDLTENIFRVFWLVPFFAYGFFVLQGAIWLEIKRRHLGVMLLFVCAVAGLALNFRENNLRTDHFGEDYGRIILRSIPPGVPLVASVDGDVGPVAYTNLILKENPTIKLYTGPGVFFRNRIVDPQTKGQKRWLQHTINFVRENGPIYSLKGLPIFAGQKELPINFDFNGITYRYTVNPEKSEPISDTTLAATELALKYYVDELHLNNWPYHRAAMAARLCNILVLRGVEKHEVFERSPDCQQVLARHMVATGRREQGDEYFMKWIKAMRHPIVSEKQEFLFHFFINRLEIVNALKSHERQQQLFKEALSIVETSLFDYPLCDNKLYPVLNSIKNQVKLSSAALEQLSVFAKCE
ncbi:MAG: hypothetical protein A2Z20_00525 [Bdellovibrionales bacterium RBG_16_40_8]|nr:MAG: hypothetical protein A2Z20_00525 [Bdellovibrionales bacterium RBG_16_40_8]